mgnify:CR=1 FL=1
MSIKWQIATPDAGATLRVRLALGAALLTGCLSGGVDTGSEIDALPVGQWLYVWPEHPLPDDAPSTCVAPQCEQAIRLQADGAVLLSETGTRPEQRGSWSADGLSLDGFACMVSVIDPRFPTFDVNCEGVSVKVGRWPYDDAPHERTW